MKPSEMTNEELADTIANHHVNSDMITEAAKRLRYIPEPDLGESLALAGKAIKKALEPPKPEFRAGWTGRTYDGVPVEIYAIKKNRLIGAYFNDNGGEKDCWAPKYWNLDGSHTGLVMSNGPSLKSNTPEPEIWWRVKGGNKLRKAAAIFGSKYSEKDIEKIELRVIE